MAKRTYGTRAARTMKTQDMKPGRGAWALQSEMCTFPAPRSTIFPASRAFTLIEMLVVIAVISLLAAMIFPITGAIARTGIRTKARSEMEQITTGIENYKSKLGHYPPDNNPSNLFTNQLYFELMGTTNDDSYYFTRDGSARIKDSVNNFRSFLGPATAVNGFVNSTKKSGGDEARTMTTFLPGGVKPTQIPEMAR